MVVDFKDLVDLADLETRYANIRRMNPRVKRCSVGGCKNPRDFTPLLEDDTCCAFHRLLFDYWSCEIMSARIYKTTEGRRRAFTNWMNKIGNDTQTKIVLRLAQESINWEC